MFRAPDVLAIPFVKDISRRYRSLFSIREIEESLTLQLFFGAMLLYFVTTFQKWVHFDYLSTSKAPDALCWPYFPDCGALFFFTSLPQGYTQNFFYMALFGVLLLAAYFVWKKNWVAAHVCLLLLFAWKM